MKKQRTIYLDYMATTPIDPNVIPKMLDCMSYDGNFGNPSSYQHAYGQKAAHIVAQSRQQIADVIGASSEEIIFTSGATEANNIAILGAARFYQRKGKHLITMSTEHKSCLATFEQLEREGFKVTYLNPEPNGLLNLDELNANLRDDTILVSIMHVNNETGIIQDIKQIGEILAHKGIIFHVDAAQSAGKLKINLQNLNVHLMSLSAHKNYGPKGIGALFIRQKPRVRLQAQNFGGGQELGLRSGTLATHQIIGMSEAFKISEQLREDEQKKIKNLRDYLWKNIQEIPGVVINCDLKNCIAGILNFSIKGIDGEELLTKINSKLAVSTMSACSSAKTATSYVLSAMGIDESIIKSSMRLSIGRFTSESDIELAIQTIKSVR